MKINRFAINLWFLSTILFSCGLKNQAVKPRSKDISAVITEMTEIMVHDITNPPLAARFFSYACLAGYEIVAQNNPKLKNMHGLLRNYPKIEKPDAVQAANYQLAALLAMMETAKKNAAIG